MKPKPCTDTNSFIFTTAVLEITENRFYRCFANGCQVTWGTFSKNQSILQWKVALRPAAQTALPRGLQLVSHRVGWGPVSGTESSLLYAVIILVLVWIFSWLANVHRSQGRAPGVEGNKYSKGNQLKAASGWNNIPLFAHTFKSDNFSHWKFLASSTQIIPFVTLN